MLNQKHTYCIVSASEAKQAAQRDAQERRWCARQHGVHQVVAQHVARVQRGACRLSAAVRFIIQYKAIAEPRC
jgi:hypothetical protein